MEACTGKFVQKSLSLPAAQAGLAPILIGLQPSSLDIMSSGSWSMMTFSTMNFTWILPEACLRTSAKVRVSSKKRIESLFLRFSLLDPRALESPLHGKPPMTKTAVAPFSIASAIKAMAHLSSKPLTSRKRVSLILFFFARWFANGHFSAACDQMIFADVPLAATCTVLRPANKSTTASRIPA